MAELDVSHLITVSQAIAIIDAVPVTPRTVRLPLSEAVGRRLAQDVTADRDYPPFHKSLMDGYAVRAADVVNTPAELKVIERLPAGRVARSAVGAGQSIAIMTGAPMPEGAEGVVPVEDVDELGDVVRVRRADGIARNVAFKGRDCAAGKTVLQTGTVLGPAQVAVAATVGAAEVEVYDLPRVAVLGTGDELAPPDRTPLAHQIRNSNNPMTAALLQRLGCRVVDLGTAPDNVDYIRARIIEGLEHDALFVSGGMSMGEHDYVPRILQEVGVELRVTKLKIKPGKPFLFGVKPRPGGGHGFVFGLPGNPVSGFVCTVRLAARLIDRLAGGPPQERWQNGRLIVGLPANGPREFYMPAVRSVVAARVSAQAVLPTIRALEWKGSADVFTLAAANCLLVRAAGEPPLPEGTLVRVLETFGSTQ
jgi:molybdopterin molybdotransferase